MKKTLLAAAIAVGFAGAAQAQTNVTLYGVVDGGVSYLRFKDGNSSNKATRFGLDDGVQQGNRWGLRGTEDLGGGLRAVFQLESGWSLVTGQSQQGNRLFGREASLGLSSDSWGTVRIGRQTNFASRYAGGVLAPQGDAFKESHIGATFTSTATVRADNMITYETPVFSGFQFGLGYSFQVAGGQPFDVNGVPDADTTMLTLGVRYNNGPLAVALTYDQLDAPETAPATTKDVKSWLLAGSYDFDVVRLHLGFGQDINGTFAARNLHNTALGGGFATQNQFQFFTGVVPNNKYKTSNYSIGLNVPLSTGEIGVSWQSARLGSGGYKDARKAANGETSQNIYSARYTYPFSNRTNLYAVGTYGNGYAFNDVKVTQLIVGLRHRF